ncbi:MAG: GerAB/ArcD/ProY family transporter [Lachnospiraceae bacterium]|nr:GerAB/ArcD/ProY family transporter [Lachnospiraceae bacterium]
MFSKNNKISKRQIFRLLTYDLLGIGTLLLPTALANKAGRNGALSIGIAIAAGVIFAGLLGGVIHSMQEDESYSSYLRRCFGKIGGKLALLGYGIYYLFLGGYCTYVFGHLIISDLLKEQSFYWVCAGILLLAVYGIFQGIEGRARIYEILFWFLMIPLFLMLFFSAEDVDIPRLFPLYTSGNDLGVFQGSYMTFSIFSLSSFSLFLVPFAAEKKQIKGACMKAVGFCGGVLLVLYIILQGSFGIGALQELEYPAVTLMSMIQIPGGFLQRQDALMVAVWFYTVFALLSSSMFYASETVKELLFKQKGKFSIVLTALILFGIGVWCYRSKVFSDMLLKLFFTVATPLAVGIPLLARLLLGFKKKKKHISALAAVLCCMCVFSGCSTMELENRNFPLAMGIDKDKDECRISYKFEDLSSVADQNAAAGSTTDFYIRDKDFYTAMSKYANDTNKVLDYNHMKVLVLSKEFVEDAKDLEYFLDVCESKDLIARNTLLFLAEDAGEILALDKNLDRTIGSYLEELIESRKDYELKDAVTLGDIFNEIENKEQLLLIPVLTEKGKLPVIESYYAFSGGEAKGEIDINEAVLSYLTQGKIKYLSFILEDGTPISIERIRVKNSFSRGDEIRYLTQIQLEVSVEGEKKNVKKELTKLFEAQLEKTAQKLFKTPGIDMTNSFYRLGMGNRKKYTEYQNRIDAYEKELQLDFEVEIILVQ